MIEVTDIAASALLESLQASGIDSERGLRLTKEEGEQLTLSLDSPGDNDRIIKHRDSILIIVDRDMEKDLGSALIDIGDDDTEESTLVIYTNR